MQISPQKEWVIVWNGADPNDTDTLYVQAKVQDAHTLAVLDTVNLVDRGSHLFSKGWITPADPSQTGTGRQIIISMTVYTDSLYTVPSQNYSRVSNDYLVKKLVDANSFFGAGGSTFDAKEMKRAVMEALADMKAAEPEAEAHDLTVQDLTDSVVKPLKEEMAKLEREPEPLDLSPLSQRLDSIREAIASLPQPAKPTDILPIARALGDIPKAIRRDIADQTRQLIAGIERGNSGIAQAVAEAVRNQVADAITKAIADGSFRISMFGDTNPFDGSGEKKQNYLNGLRSKYLPKK